MTEKIEKHGVEISKEGQHLKIYIPSFSTLIIIYQEDKKHFIRYLKYIYNKYNVERTPINDSSILYGKDRIYFGNSFSVKYPKFGNFLEIKKIPIILDLLDCDGFEYCSIISIIKKIKKKRGCK